MVKHAEGEGITPSIDVVEEGARRRPPGIEARLAQLEAAAGTLPTAPPAWLEDIQPENPPADATNGLHRIVGAWPGDESDEIVAAALEDLS